MKFLIDTHILLWWYLKKSQLSKKHLSLLVETEKKEDQVGLSVISLWEIARLVAVGRYEVSFSLDRWFKELETDNMVKVLPLSGSISLESNRLGEHFHKDPADQMIVATARCYGLPLMTVDKKIIHSEMVTII